MREEGYYWVKRYGEWIVAQYDPSLNFFTISGNDDIFSECEFEEIGPKIEPPTTKGSV